MRYFKAEIVYEMASNNNSSVQLNQVLYCCSANGAPESEDLIELFYSLNAKSKKYLHATWKQVREEEIPTEEIHLL